MSDFLVTLRTKREQMELSKRYSIAYKGLKNGLHDFDFKVGADLFEAFESADIRGGECDVHLSLSRAEGLLELSVTIDGDVVVECDRCLEEFDLPIQFEGNLVVKLSDEANDYDGEVMWLSPSESMLDLSQYLYESIVLSLPYQRVHPEGECDPDMLERFDVVSGTEMDDLEARAAAELREAQSGEWAKLEVLRGQLSEQEAASDNKKEDK